MAAPPLRTGAACSTRPSVSFRSTFPAGGALVGYAGGLEAKKRLLELEGAL